MQLRNVEQSGIDLDNQRWRQIASLEALVAALIAKADKHAETLGQASAATKKETEAAREELKRKEAEVIQLQGEIQAEIAKLQEEIQKCTATQALLKEQRAMDQARF